MAAGMNQLKRVATLETTQRNRDRKPIAISVVVMRLGETREEAKARHVAQHGPLPGDDEADVSVILMKPVAPLYQYDAETEEMARVAYEAAYGEAPDGRRVVEVKRGPRPEQEWRLQ